LFCLASEFF
jgi:hypothetical protein